MKKLGIIAVLAVVGAGAAFAATLGVPWYVDNAGVASKIPQTQYIGNSRGAVTGVVTLKSNRTDTLECSITYYDANGNDLGPAFPNNTFSILPLSSLAFRPGVYDPSAGSGLPGGAVGGQEGAQGAVVPDNPSGNNGSLVISWVGDPTDIQGQVAWFQSSIHPNESTGNSDPRILTFSYAHLLPPGV